MSAQGQTVRRLGFFMIAVFVGMALALKIWVEPKTGFLPQNLQTPYTDERLLKFVTDLENLGLSGFYRAMLFVDLVFIAMFAAWCSLAHMSLSASPLRAVGLVFVLAAVVLDIREDWLLLGLISSGAAQIVIELPIKTSGLWGLTLAKFAAFLVCLLSTYIFARRMRR